MKTIKQWVSTILLVLTGLFTAYAQQNQQAITFEDAMQVMIAQNPALLQAKQKIKQKEYEQKAKRGLFLPQVSLNASAVSMSDMIHLDLTQVQSAITPLYNAMGNYGVFSGVPNPNPATNQQFSVLPDNVSTAVVREKMLEAGNEVASANWDQVIQEKNFATVNADFMWPVFTGGKIKAANDAAGVDLEISNEELRETEGILLTELATRYYGLSLGIQVLEVRQQMYDGMKKHYSDAQKLFDNGIIAKVELLHANVSLNETERELKQAERNIDIIRSGLDATLAFDTVAFVIPASQLFINKELDDLATWVEMANALNPQIKQIEGKNELIEIKNNVDKGEYLPTVAMIGTFNLAEQNLSPYIPDWVVGVGMKWTVFEGLGRRNKIKAGETMQSQVAFAKEKAHADLKAYLTTLYQELQMQMEQKTELESTLQLAEEYASSTEKAFGEGLATSTAVVDAYTKVAQVKALRLKVFYDYDVTLAKLLQMAGIPEQYINYCSGENTIIESING